MTHLTFQSQIRAEDDPARIETLARKGWAILPPRPGGGYEWGGEAWVAPEVQPTRKIWPTVTQFWDELPAAARQQIALSADPNVVVLRTELAMWRGEVWADDERVTGALLFLVLLEILTEEEMESILAI
jgi:hypothetical protein